MADSDEDFVSFGEALDPLDEDNLPRKKPVTIEEQVATDAQGRRRFHGAFTGGFSAGYFNSVGTRDGWRPQQFKSSRSSKADNVSQRPEDFMDEEDTGEFGIAPTGIRATSDFTDHARGQKRERAKASSDGPIPGVPVLQDLLKPVKDTVGVSLLKKMGWRPGQGVGPRVSKIEKRKTKKRNVKKKIYGCSLPNEEFKSIQDSEGSSSADDDAADDDDEEILFAPDDYEPYRAKPKDNYFGIGYSGLDRRSVLGHVNLFEAPTFRIQDKNKKLSIRGQAFGVGAFEADDEDIYARDDMSRYDFTLGPAETKKTSRSSRADKSHAECLEGFTPAKNQLERKKVYNPPELPSDFKPIHLIKKSRFSPQDEPENTEDYKRKGLGRHDLNAESRSAILGESSSGSVAASPAANIIVRTLNLHGREQTEERAKQEAERTKAAASSWMDKLEKTSFVRGGVEGSGGESMGKLKNLQDFKSQLLSVADCVKTVKTFVDETKQKRFEKFQEFSKDERKEKIKTIQPLSMTEWEREHEFEEFKLAAGILENKNSSNAHDNNNRFTKEAIASVDSDIPKDSMVDAAKVKMFGKLTRTVEAWQPASIVCKRFNIPEPNSGCCVKEEKNKKYSVFDSLDLCMNNDKFKKATDTAGTYKEPDIPYKPGIKNSGNNKQNNSIIDISDIDAGPSKSNDRVKNFEASYEKVFGQSNLSTGAATRANQDKSSDNAAAAAAEMHSVITSSSKDKNDEKKDLFKAIFLSSSEEDSSESDKDKDDDDDDDIKSVLIGKSEKNKVNAQRNNSPPRGIFAKLDLDNLLVPDKNSVNKINKNSSSGVAQENKVTVSSKEHGGEINSSNDVEILADMYGPALPVNKSSNEESSGSSRVFRSVVIPKVNYQGEEDVEWVERGKSKKAKKEKKKHKHKEKKHKHKSKKSKK